jgi:hypothetical protein
LDPTEIREEPEERYLGPTSQADLRLHSMRDV